MFELTGRFPAAVRAHSATCPLLAHAIGGGLAALRPALEAEVRAEQDKDCAHGEPLRRELEAFRFAERRERGTDG